MTAYLQCCLRESAGEGAWAGALYGTHNCFFPHWLQQASYVHAKALVCPRPLRLCHRHSLVLQINCVQQNYMQREATTIALEAFICRKYLPARAGIILIAGPLPCLPISLDCSLDWIIPGPCQNLCWVLECRRWFLASSQGPQ